ncbi:REST corepressor 3-like isoform X1 [Homalodisca vitripennis]|uniref:REST corepressor 3-like isoform X1 n=1 Tax=Homalodisca vitripennis TaxID=197043 RepID=UPI001EECA11F|nr:REST corepressor 3-like isoform X1 [Homalodisca vitripennis]
MVLADRNSESIRNGRRSRGPSPNGHPSESSSEDEGEKIRVGRDYQAVIPEFVPVEERRLEQCPDRALLVWSPTIDISDTKLDEYISLAKEKYGYNGEQALGMLFWHKHDLEKAICDLANFTPFPDEWTVEDKVLFEQAYQFHGKSFHRIRQMLPDKTIATLVKYYYSWKKTRSRTSLMDRQARKMAGRGGAGEDGAGSDMASDMGSNSDSDNEEKKWTIHRGIQRKSCSPPRPSQTTEEAAKDKEGGEGRNLSCSNCSVACSHVQSTPKGSMCNTCYTHWRRTGNLRPTVGPTKPRDRQLLLRNKRKPPRGMYVNHDDLVAMASGPTGQGEQMLKAMDREIVSLKRQVQNNKQVLSSLKRKSSEGVDVLRPPDNNGRINARWTNDELLLAVQGMRKYGKDFQAIAEVIGTKTEVHMRSFFINYRRRFNLDAVLLEYEAEHGPIQDNDDKMEVDVVVTGSEVASSSSPPSTPSKQSPVVSFSAKTTPTK